MTHHETFSAATFAPPCPNRHRVRKRLSPIALVAALMATPHALPVYAQQGASAQPEYYVVKRGDTLGAIAKRFGLDYRELARWNDITDAGRIDVGRRLRLSPPAAPAVPATAARETARALPPGAASQPVAPSAPAEGAESRKQQRELAQLRATTAGLIELLLSQGLITREKAEELMRQAQLGPLPTAEQMAAAQALEHGTPGERPAGAGAAPGTAAGKGTPEATEPGVVRVPYVPEIVKNEIRDQIREDVIAQAKAERWAEPSALPEWLDRITLEGDIRLRYQGDYYPEGNTPAPIYNAITGSDLDNTTQDEELLRYRVRFGVLAKLSESWGAAISLASGNTTNPVSTNQSLGDYANRGLVTIDRAYLRWSPSERWIVSGGRIPNPYFHTSMVWDEDLGFEGVAGTFKPKFNEQLGGFFTAGAFLVEHESSTSQTPSPQNKWLYGLQAGADWRWSGAGRLRAALTYYPYTNVEGIPNPTLGSQIYDWTAPAFVQKGNTLFNIDADSDPNTALYALASKFEILNLTAAVDLAYFDPYLVRITADYASNLGFDGGEIQSRTGLNPDARTTAYSLGFTFGKESLSRFGDWDAFFTYKYLQADSVLDAFTDSDFHLGGTNAKGYIIGGRLALDRNVWLRLRWLSADEIDGPPLGIDVLQIDLNARF
jgi:LysM repeat protein